MTPDNIHQGFDAFRAYIELTQPRFFIHAHQHLSRTTQIGATMLPMRGVPERVNATVPPNTCGCTVGVNRRLRLIGVYGEAALDSLGQPSILSVTAENLHRLPAR